MKKLLNKAERRFGKYSIQGLMKYIIAIEIAGAVIGIINHGYLLLLFIA